MTDLRGPYRRARRLKVVSGTLPSAKGNEPMCDLDLSAELPAAKAYSCPLSTCRSDVINAELRVKGIVLRGEARVRQSLYRPLSYCLVCGAALGCAAGAASFSQQLRLSTSVTAALTCAMFVLTLLGGVFWLSRGTRRKRRRGRG